jgi:hypothetical protein
MGKYIVDLYIEGIGDFEVDAANESEAIRAAKNLTINQVLDICYLDLSTKVIWVDFEYTKIMQQNCIKKELFSKTMYVKSCKLLGG